MSIDQVSYQIGVLQNTVETLAAAVAANTKITDETKRAVSSQKNDVATIKRDVAEMKPVVSRVTKYEQRGAAIAFVFSILGGLGGITTWLSWSTIRSWLA